MNPQAVAAWFALERGISAETLRAFNVTMDLDRGNVLFPYPNGVKERPDPSLPKDEGRKRFYFTKGQVPELFRGPMAPADFCFLVEGETDTMSTWEHMPGTPVYGIGGVNTWRSSLAAELAQYKRVYVILDNDDYNAASTIEQVNNVWRQIRQDLPQAKRITLPGDVKDLCEFWGRGYDVEYLKLLCNRTGLSRYETVDFSKPPPPVEWVLENWIAAGDVCVLASKGGLGKSWFTMGAALAVLNGSKQFVGENVTASGNVLYVDEENPLDVVHTRMKRLGLVHNAGNLRYLWKRGIRLDRKFDQFIDEALDFKPRLIVLDSFTRLHSKEEKDNGAMAALFNDALSPLAVETGAAVLLIHHHGHGREGPRGGTDIFNAADAVIDMKRWGQDGVEMTQSKTRRSGRGDNLTWSVVDKPDGSAELVHNTPFKAPF